MKKVLFCMLLALPFVFSSCSKDDDENYSTSDIVGNWKLEKCVVSEVKTNNDELTKAITKDIENEKDDSVYSFTSDGKFKADNEELGTFTLSGNKLTLVSEDESITNQISISGNKFISYVDETEYYRMYINDFIDDTANVTISKVVTIYHYVKLDK